MVAITSIFFVSGNSVNDNTSKLSICCLNINEISLLIDGAVISTGLLFSVWSFSIASLIAVTTFWIKFDSKMIPIIKSEGGLKDLGKLFKTLKIYEMI